jgi:hypothetical protein
MAKAWRKLPLNYWICESHAVSAISSNNYKNENIQHITATCRALTHLHNQVANIVHQEVAIKCGLSRGLPMPYYKYEPQSVLENCTYKLYSDMSLATGRTVHTNGPGVKMFDKTIKEACLIDVEFPDNQNLHSTNTEKIPKHTDLKEGLISTWQLNTAFVMPFALSTSDIISNKLHDSFKTFNLSPAVYFAMQKSVILNACCIVANVLGRTENREVLGNQLNYYEARKEDDSNNVITTAIDI